MHYLWRMLKLLTLLALFQCICTQGLFLISTFQSFFHIFFKAIFNYLDFASNQITREICAGNSVVEKCTNTATTTYTLMIDEALNGVKGPTSIGCSLKYVLCYFKIDAN